MYLLEVSRTLKYLFRGEWNLIEESITLKYLIEESGAFRGEQNL